VTQILITGSTGMLGTQLCHVLKKYELIGISRKENRDLDKQYNFDLCDIGKINNQYLNISPDVIIHTAANVNLKNCESNKDLTYKLHVAATQKLVYTFPNAKFIYISTDSVFDGTEKTYNENSIPNPLNYYAYSKLIGEKKVLEFSKNPLVIRTNIIGENQNKNSFSDWIIGELNRGNKLSGYSNIYFNPIHVKILAEIISNLIKRKLGHKILNIGSIEKISKFDYMKMLSNLLGFNSELIVEKKIKIFNDKIMRPFNTFLDTSLLSSYVQNDFPINESLNKFILK
tara:strand:+ start:512 stop:1369 length:858 start_codon:yes stop_codon:yes gene_type:complete